MRRPLVAGNWKMNLTLGEARSLAVALATGVKGELAASVDITICPSSVYIAPVRECLGESSLTLGLQNIFYEPMGAFTGEVSARMAREVGATHVILGHSERRHTIGHLESDWMINRKVHAALGAGLSPILCVGETLAQRQAGQTLAVLTFQIEAGLSGVGADALPRVVIAYEPVWAIGTGQNATPEQAQEAHQHIRAKIRGRDAAGADRIRIVYGGSVTPENAARIFEQPDVDGGLIGGASLKAESFLAIVRAALAAAR